ncbi:MAG: GEVED domain-containing protein, partial [Bacteroidota bacterium]
MISKFTTAVRTGIAASLMLIATLTSKAQVQAVEGFDQPSGNALVPIWPASNLPNGWSMSVGLGANAYWDRMNNPGVLPACSPKGGTAMVRARTAYMVVGGDVTYLVSKPYDLSQRGGVGSNCRFWIYRDGFNAVDNIQVFANTAPVAAGAALFDTANVTQTIPRYYLGGPAVASAGWYLYGFQLPPGAAYTQPQVYIIIKVTHGPAATTSNVYIDEFSITTYPGVQTYNLAAGITLVSPQNTSIVAKGSNNNDILSILVNTTGAGAGNVGLSAGNFNFLPNGSTISNPNPVDVGTTKLWWTGGSSSFNALTAQQIGTYTGAMTPSWNISGAGLAGLDNGDNYFWLTYDIPAGATSNNCVDADFISAVIGGVTRTCGVTGCTTAGCRLIDINPPCIPTYTAGDSWLNGSYTDNDYVKWVVCAGDPAYPPGINNDHNDVIGSLFPIGAGFPADPCVPSSGYLNSGAGGLNISPFSNHPPDYQKIPIATVGSMPSCVGAHGANSSRTAVFLETSVAPPTYNINVQVGTWFGANCIAAWFDWNHDGVFNNTMWNLGGEKLLQSGYMNMLTFVNANFQVPVTGYYGPTTLRVREWYANPNMDACSPGYYGEVEDYTVTLRPDCSPLYPGWKIWLGYTDDWNVNSNWCGGVPLITDNALIPGKGINGFNRGAGTYHPVIKTGVAATTRKLVMLNDTVEVNAPTGGSLRISDSLSIGVSTTVNTSALIVDSSYLGTATVLNGAFVDNNSCPFRSSYREQKAQFMYKTAELTGQGLIDGDMIDEIWVPIRLRQSTTTYQMTITMWYSDNTNANYPTFTTTGFASVVPVAGNASAIAVAGLQTVYTGNILMTSQVPGASGTYKIILQNPFRFDAVTAGGRPMIIEMCYEMTANSTS